MNKVEKLQNVTLDELTAFFTDPKAVRESKVAVKTANMAIQTLSAVGRIKATERARDGLKLTILRHLVTDKKQFKKYVSASMPEINPIKQITT